MTPAVKAPKLPRASAAAIMIDFWYGKVAGCPNNYSEGQPVVVLPFRTITAARQFVKVWEMETDEQIEHLAKKLSSFSGEPKWRSLKPQDRLYYRRIAMDALCALHFNPGEK